MAYTMYALVNSETGAWLDPPYPGFFEEEPTPGPGEEFITLPFGVGELCFYVPATKSFTDIAPSPITLTEWEFRLLFTNEERWGILEDEQTNVIIKDILGLLAAAKNGLDLSHPQLVSSVEYLASPNSKSTGVSYITEARRDEILAGNPPA